jgi:hypothetical protein
MRIPSSDAGSIERKAGCSRTSLSPIAIRQQWIKDARGNPLYWPVDDYHLEGKRETKWFIDGVVKYHRTVETYVTTLISTDFSLHSLKEPVPIHGPSATVPDLDLHRQRAPFLLIAADLKR